MLRHREGPFHGSDDILVPIIKISKFKKPEL